MHFASPYYLWLLTALVPMAGYYVWRTLQGGAAIQISSVDGVVRAPKTIRYYLRHLPFVLRAAAFALLVVALARPQDVERLSRTNTEGIDIMLAIDVSGSMLARDFRPDRITAAKEVAGSFIADRYGDRIGLVAFAGEAFTQSPLTTDQSTLQTLLSRIRSGLIEDGTAIGNGLATAINRLRESEAKSKVIILLTDGVNNRGEIAPQTAAEIAKAQGIRVYTIGVGTEGMAPLPRRGHLRHAHGRHGDGQGRDRRKDPAVDRRDDGRGVFPRHGQGQAESHLRPDQPTGKEQGGGYGTRHLPRTVPLVGAGGAAAAVRGVPVRKPGAQTDTLTGTTPQTPAKPSLCRKEDCGGNVAVRQAPQVP